MKKFFLVSVLFFIASYVPMTASAQDNLHRPVASATPFQHTEDRQITNIPSTPNARVEAPLNDNCANAQALTIDGGCVSGTTVAATTQTGELPNTCITGSSGGGVTYRSVWYSFYTGSNTTLNLALILTNTTSCYSGVAVWGPYNTASAGCFPSGTAAHCFEIMNLDPGYHTQLTGLTANKYYLIQVMGRKCGGAFDDDQNFCIGVYTPPANDQITNPTFMDQCGYTYTGTNAGYAPNGCGVRHADLDCNSSTTGTACGGGTTPSVAGDDVGYVINNEAWWYFCSLNAATWQVTFNNITNCALPSPNQGLQMSIFSGTPSNLTCIQSAPSPSAPGSSWTSSTFATTVGQCIYLVVDGFAGDQCNYSFTLTNLTGGCIILPVRLTSFTAEATSSKKVKLKWTVETENPTAPYLIERSWDGYAFSAIGSLPSNRIPSTSSYEFIDASPMQGRNYYRIRYADERGNLKYSEVRTVYISDIQKGFSIFPTIASNQINVNFSDHRKIRSASIFNSTGIRIRPIGIDQNSSNLFINDLAAGVYYFVVTYNDGSTEQTPFIKQ